MPSRTTFKRLTGVFALLTLIQLASGCTVTWVTEATNIIGLLGPAITSFLGILSAFGYGLSPDTVSKIGEYEQQAQNALAEVGTLINEYNSADAAGKTTLLGDINTALGVVATNLNQILPLVNITDVGTQKKVIAVFDAILSEVQSLIQVIPAIAGTVEPTPTMTVHAQVKSMLAAVQDAPTFKKEFNTVAGEFGKNFQLQ